MNIQYMFGGILEGGMHFLRAATPPDEWLVHYIWNLLECDSFGKVYEVPGVPSEG